MTDTQQPGLTEQLFLGTAITVLLSSSILFAAGLTAGPAMLGAIATVLAALVIPARHLVWVMCTALFLSIAILPYYMLFQFAADRTVLIATLAVIANIFLLFCFTATFGPLKTRH